MRMNPKTTEAYIAYRDALEEELEALRRQQRNLLDSGMYAHGIAAVAWHSREDPTPDGALIWASDCEYVWLIRGDGKPISDYATAVKFWTEALIPEPASMAGELERAARESEAACKQLAEESKLLPGQLQEPMTM